METFSKNQVFKNELKFSGPYIVGIWGELEENGGAVGNAKDMGAGKKDSTAARQRHTWLCGEGST